MSLYVGRIVCVARASDGRVCAAYRVSSRSFPNRTAVQTEHSVSIVPKAGHEKDVQKNPYIAYNCVRIVAGGKVAVVTNGSQTDPIAEKIDAGMSARDALVLSLLALDYEKDAYNTPRICAVADNRGTGALWLGIVRKDGVNVCEVTLAKGRFQYIATYEENDIDASQAGSFSAGNAMETCDFLLHGGVFAQRLNPVTAVAGIATDTGFELATKDAPRT